MEQLVNLVSERAGIPAETARTAVETVLGYLKERLPGPIAGQIDGILGGSGSSETPGGMPSASDLGGMLGR